MNINAKKIAGWVMIIAGLTIIGQTINTSYRFFTAQADFPSVFKAPANQEAVSVETGDARINDSKEMDAQAAQKQMQQAMNQATSQAISSIIPTDLVSKLMNAIVWSIFATFLVYAGAKIAEIGIKLIA